MSPTRACFVITLTYVSDLRSVDALLDRHAAWLQEQYDKGIFLMSGRLEPRTGGIIIAQRVTRAELEVVLAEDPLRTDQVAEYDIVEFRPSMAHPAARVVVGLR